MQALGGAERGKAIIVLNPAEPPLIMRDTIFCSLPDDVDEDVLAAIPGWLAWALIYSTIGYAVWRAAVAAAAGSPVGIAVIATALAAAVAFLAVRRLRRSRRAHGASQDG